MHELEAAKGLIFYVEASRKSYSYLQHRSPIYEAVLGHFVS